MGCMGFNLAMEKKDGNNATELKENAALPISIHGISTFINHNAVKFRDHSNELVQERRNSIANALELHLSCTNPSILVKGLWAPPMKDSERWCYSATSSQPITRIILKIVPLIMPYQQPPPDRLQGRNQTQWWHSNPKPWRRWTVSTGSNSASVGRDHRLDLREESNLWFRAILQYLQCISNGDTAVLHLANKMFDLRQRSYHQTSHISHTISQNLNVSHLVLQFIEARC